MTLNSFDFLIFMIVVLPLLRFGGPYRSSLLLAASYIFYATWNLAYVPLILATSVVDFLCARKLERETDEGRRKIYLWISVGFSLSLLIYFKYAFRLINHFVPVYVPVIPIGLSFHTFQSMGYILDVYRRRIKAEKDFIDYANFVSFFPQLIAGPIERASHLLPQLRDGASFRVRTEDLGRAAYLIFLGLFMTVALSENLEVFAQPFNEINSSNAVAKGLKAYRIDYLMSVYSFPFVLYLRFAGYSLIAKGVALLMGIDLTTNFKYPFFSKSMAEFWGRWHISLSKWIRDYVFLPLSGRARNDGDIIVIIFITMWLFGIWHQASAGWLIASTILAAYSVAGHFWFRGPRSTLLGALLTFHIFAFAMIFVLNLSEDRTFAQFGEGLRLITGAEWGNLNGQQLSGLKFIAVALALDAINFYHKDIFGILNLRMPLRIAVFSFMILFLFFNFSAGDSLSLYFRM